MNPYFKINRKQYNMGKTKKPKSSLKMPSR